MRCITVRTELQQFGVIVEIQKTRAESTAVHSMVLFYSSGFTRNDETVHLEALANRGIVRCEQEPTNIAWLSLHAIYIYHDDIKYPSPQVSHSRTPP